MGAWSTYKAQRGREKALLRQLLPEINYACSEVGRAGVSLILAEAAEAAKDYSSARQYYEEVCTALANLEGLISEKQLFCTTLADSVQQATERTQEGLRSIEMKVRLTAYGTIHA